MTCCVQVLASPHESVAVQTTAFVPLGNVLGAALVTVTASPQLLDAVAVPSTTPLAEHWPGSVLAVTSAGQVMVGGVVLLTVMTCVQSAVLLEESVAR